MMIGIRIDKLSPTLLRGISVKLCSWSAIAGAAFLFTWVSMAQSAETEDLQPQTWEEYELQAQSLAPTVSLLTAEVTNGTCNQVHSLNAAMTTPIGSSFKLYILAEIAAQIGRGVHYKKDWWKRGNWPWKGPNNGKRPQHRLAWNSPLIIQQVFKSIPGGPLLFVPVGSIYTLRYIAEQMIQLSDNTATDHLLFLAGRENVERSMVRTGHHDPSLNIPLFATREFAVIKFLWSDQQLLDYQQASVRERRKLLAAEQRGWPELEAFFEVNGDQIVPVRVETQEWYANRFDLCKLMVSIYKLGQKPALRPLLEVLSLRDPIGFDREKWTYVGFKGGSEMGLQAGNWLVQRNDGRLFFFSSVFLDPEQALDLENIIPLLEAAPDLIFATP